MTELPEVEALADHLRRHAVGLTVGRVDVSALSVLKTFDPPVTALAGQEVTGAHRSQIIRQFLGESLVLTLISGLVSLVIVLSALGLFNKVTWKNLAFSDLLQLPVILGFLFIVFFTTLLSGSFPSFLL